MYVWLLTPKKKPKKKTVIQCQSQRAGWKSAISVPAHQGKAVTRRRRASERSFLPLYLQGHGEVRVKLLWGCYLPLPWFESTASCKNSSTDPYWANWLRVFLSWAGIFSGRTKWSLWSLSAGKNWKPLDPLLPWGRRNKSITAKGGDIFANCSFRIASRKVARIKCSKTLGISCSKNWRKLIAFSLGFMILQTTLSGVTADLSNMSQCVCVH